MHRPPDVDNVHDFNQYYRGAWIGYKQNTQNYTPILIGKALNEDGRAFSCSKIVGPNNELEDANITWENIRNYGQFGHPRMGAINVGDTCLYLTRNTPRAAQRGYRANTITCAVHGAWLYTREGLKYPMAGDYSTVYSIFNPTYFTFKQGLDALMQGERVAVGLTPKILLVSEEGLRDPAVYYGAHPVGYLEGGYLLNTINSQAIELAKNVRAKFPEIMVV